MAEPRTYKVPLDELVRQARVGPDDQVEEVATGPVDTSDVRGPQPDRDWFASGG